jgi:hypothetical protein
MKALFALCMGLSALSSLVGCAKGPSEAETNEEISRREKYVKSLLVVDGGPAPATRVGSTTEVHFEEGFTGVQFDPPDDARSHAFRWMGQRGHVRVRTRGRQPMHLRVAGWLHEKVLHQRGTVAAYLNGQITGPAFPTDEKGIFVIDETLDPALFHDEEWVDLHIMPSSVVFHWADPPDLKVVVIFDFQWEPATPR